MNKDRTQCCGPMFVNGVLTLWCGFSVSIQYLPNLAVTIPVNIKVREIKELSPFAGVIAVELSSLVGNHRDVLEYNDNLPFQELPCVSTCRSAESTEYSSVVSSQVSFVGIRIVTSGGKV